MTLVLFFIILFIELSLVIVLACTEAMLSIGIFTDAFWSLFTTVILIATWLLGLWYAANLIEGLL